MKDRGSTAGGYRAVVIGASAGGLAALGKLLSFLPETFPPTVIIVQHMHPAEGGYLVEFLDGRCAVPVHEAEDKMPALPANVYVAPANYHLLVEKEETLSLSIDARTNYVLECSGEPQRRGCRRLKRIVLRLVASPAGSRAVHPWVFRATH
ncbi:MAG: hypothetical protein HY788_16380 [Deltaproteobacteria bacterium]|nr:hypothetical protein [Deltaproteobacteria bacterium]